MSNEQRVMEQPGEDKQEGGCGTERVGSTTTDLVSSSTDVSLDLAVEDEASLGSEKIMFQAKTGCRLHRIHEERTPEEEPTAAPLSRRAARKARKATSKAVLVSNMSTAQEASTPDETPKKVAKKGRDAREKDSAPSAAGSDHSDISVVAGPSSATSSKPGAKAKATDVTAKALNQADDPCEGMHRRLYPPELESFYEKARRDREWTGLAKQLKTSLIGAKSTVEKEVIANAIYDLIDEVKAELGDDGAPIAPRGLRWETATTFEIQAPTWEDKLVRKALDALMRSKALKDLGGGDDYDFPESAQQWWDRHQPSTAVPKDLESSTIEALSLYGDHIKELMRCRARLDLRMRAHSAASSRLGSASKTLQCLVRQGTYRIDFWRSRQQSAQRGVRQATKALHEARVSEARVVSTLDEYVKIHSFLNQYSVPWRRCAGSDRCQAVLPELECSTRTTES